MRPTLTRREAAFGLAGAGLLLPSAARSADIMGLIAPIEARVGGRIGAAVSAPGRSGVLAHRGDERFPLCSTFKLLAAALVLDRVDRSEERLDRRIVFGRDDLVTYSPVTQSRVGGDGMTVAEICHAALTRSDNTAGNLLLASFGGPPAITAFARRLGDRTTRLDRTEPTLNEALPGDPRDTTTPAAMLGMVAALLFGDVLRPASRDQLERWLLANETGGARIRAGAPAGWRIGDKTGTGDNGAANDVAVLWPSPSGAPLALTIYLHSSTRPVAELNVAIAEVAGIMIAAAIGRGQAGGG